MSEEWEDMEPLVKVVPRVMASVYINKDRKVRLRVTLSETIRNLTKRAERCNVQFAGNMQGEARLRIIFDKDGKFTVKDLGLGGARISHIPAKAPIPEGNFESLPCEVETENEKELIVKLPVEGWKKSVSHERQAPGRKPEATQALPMPPQLLEALAPVPFKMGKVNLGEYLEAKKHKIVRSKDNITLWVDGERKTLSDALVIANGYRERAELPKLRLDDVF